MDSASKQPIGTCAGPSACVETKFEPLSLRLCLESLGREASMADKHNGALSPSNSSVPHRSLFRGG